MNTSGTKTLGALYKDTIQDKKVVFFKDNHKMRRKGLL